MPKTKKDLALLRTQYAAYRRKAQASPEGTAKVISFKAWLRKRNQDAE